MAYGKAFEISYLPKSGGNISYFEKRLEVFLEGFTGDPEIISGREDLFTLSYISDTKDKGQTIMATEAEINVYANSFFNIDNLATSGEMDIKVLYYEEDFLMWTGFVIPDFFQTDIRPNPVITMVATDRIGVLKDIPFDGKRTKPYEIVEDCLEKTGLGLYVNVRYQYSYFGTANINLERYDDMTCHEVLVSVLTAFNMKVVQFRDAWRVVNKRELETEGFSDDITFNLVDINGMREIKPVASEVSMKMEFGGSQRYPKNWNLQKIGSSTTFEDWTVIGLVYANYSQVTGYTVSGSVQNAILGSNTNVRNMQYRSLKMPALGDVNVLNYPHNKSSFTTFNLFAGIDYKLNFRINFTSASNVNIGAYILVRKGSNYYVYHRGINNKILVGSAGSGTPDIRAKNPFNVESANRDTFGVVQTQWEQEIEIDKSVFGISDESDDSLEMQIIIMRHRSYTSPITETDVFINSAELVLNDEEVTGKGLIFKIKQGGSRFSKARKEQKIHFSDKILTGVNGYFYNYKNDDTSITNLPTEFILRNTLTEQAAMFGKARNLLKLTGNIEVNPLAKYLCDGREYVFIGGKSNRKNAYIELEEIVESDLTKTDYIYTYFD